MNNIAKTILLFGILGTLIVFLGGMIGGEQGVTMAFFMALTMNLGMYFFSDKIALKMSGAKEMEKSKYPQIFQMVERLSEKMGMPAPKLFITPEPQANAFATGRGPGSASVAFTSGILQNLDPNELEAVVAHELSHVKNRDILIATIAAVMASTISYLSHFALWGRDDNGNRSGGLGLIVALIVPLVASLVQLGISREREFGADHTGATTIGSGKTLASALLKIHSSTRQYPMRANSAISSLYIGEPRGTMLGKLGGLFSTHPPLEERIKRLEDIK